MLPYLKTIRWYLFFNFLLVLSIEYLHSFVTVFHAGINQRGLSSSSIWLPMSVAGYLSCNYIQMILDWKQGIIFSTTLKNEWFRSLLGLSHHDFKQKTVAEYISFQSNDLDSLERITFLH